MDEGAQALVAVVVGTLSLLLIIRIAIAFPGWVRRVRRPETRAVRVVGVGGAGSNAVDRMLEEGVSGVDFVAINTDAQALRRSTVRGKIRIGRSITGGLGSGGDPDVGRQSAEDDVDRISGAVGGADLVFVAAGLGGGTGSGAAPVVARQAREQGALTVAIVTKPFAFEGTKRQRIADEAAQLLLVEVDALITIPNDRVDQVLDETASIVDAFQAVDHVLVQAVEGILGLLTGPGLINLDFADIRAVVRGAGRALIGVGRGSGEGRAVDAARQAISSPLLEASIGGARNILFDIAGPVDLELREVREAADVIRASTDPEANVIFGASRIAPGSGEVVITLIATGLNASAAPGWIVAPTSLERTPTPAASLRPRLPRRPRPATVAVGDTVAASEPAGALTGDADDYDIPSFLRRGRAASSH